MPYILSAQRDADPRGAFKRYADYIESGRHRFPPSALALLDSDWYLGFSDHRAPHDAWLEDVHVTEKREDGDDSRPQTTIQVRLLGAYHDGMIQFTYTGVLSYSLQMADLSRGHCDWRYDEFRVSDAGNLIHEIEWCAVGDTGRWLIEAQDVTHSWHPFDNTSPAGTSPPPA